MISQMHRIEDAARLAMGDLRAGEAPIARATRNVFGWLQNGALAAVCIGAATLAFNLY